MWPTRRRDLSALRHDLPIFYNDNPGNMVGPEAENRVGAPLLSQLLDRCQLSVLFFVIIRKAIGLGKLAMTGRYEKACSQCPGRLANLPAWASKVVKLGRRMNPSIEDPEERIAAYERWVAEL